MQFYQVGIFEQFKMSGKTYTRITRNMYMDLTGTVFVIFSLLIQVSNSPSVQYITDANPPIIDINYRVTDEGDFRTTDENNNRVWN